jgi:hypothetical protein
VKLNLLKYEGISETVELTTTKGERSRTDALAAEGIGTACTRADERMSAALGLAQSTATRFEAAADVSMGGATDRLASSVRERSFEWYR